MALTKKYSVMGLGRKRKRRSAPKRKQRGKGIGEFLSSLGGGLGKGANNLLSGLFGGARRRKAAPKVRRVRRVRRVRGRGVLGDLNDLAKETQVVSKALNKFGPSWLGNAASRLGYGRKKMRGGSYRTIVW